MPEPIVFISRSRIGQGMRDEFGAAFRRAVQAMAETKPRTALEAAYLNETGTEVTIVHVFPDATAMLAHFEGSDERTASVADLITLIGFEVYGRAPAAAIAQLRLEARRSGFPVEFQAESIGGFLRAPA